MYFPILGSSGPLHKKPKWRTNASSQWATKLIVKDLDQRELRPPDTAGTTGTTIAFAFLANRSLFLFILLALQTTTADTPEQVATILLFVQTSTLCRSGGFGSRCGSARCGQCGLGSWSCGGCVVLISRWGFCAFPRRRFGTFRRILAFRLVALHWFTALQIWVIVIACSFFSYQASGH